VTNSNVIHFVFGTHDSFILGHQALRVLPPGPTSRLTTLHLDIHPKDLNFVLDIAQSTPGIRCLVLMEKADGQVCVFSLIVSVKTLMSSPPKISRRGDRCRRLWNHHTSFSESLLQLMFLETFLLKTGTALVPDAGCYLQEHNVIRSWSRGPLILAEGYGGFWDLKRIFASLTPHWRGLLCGAARGK
jgi:hypothetical protein